MEPRDCPELDRCPKLLGVVGIKDFISSEQYTNTIESICHECSGPERANTPNSKLVKTYELIAYQIKVGEEIDIAYGAVPLGIVLDVSNQLYAMILSPVVRIVPIASEEKKEKEKEPEGEKDVNTGTTSPD